MKIKRINTTFLLLALAGMTLTGCSNEDLANITPQEDGTGNVSFSIVEKDYEPADDTPKSRVAEETKPEIQDLGDGLMAEVSLVPDTTHRAETPTTRAINTPTHYTIQAYQGGVKKGELKGTFNGSTFTPDTGQPKSISLPHGTYDFVCFNDKVSVSGKQFTFNRSDAETARFTVQRGVVINPVSKQQVTFKMKHIGAVVVTSLKYVNFTIPTKVTSTEVTDEDGNHRYKCEVYLPEEKYKYTFETPEHSIPETMTYDFATDSYTYPAMGKYSANGEFDAGDVSKSVYTPGQISGNTTNQLPLSLYLPTTDLSKLKLTFTYGTVYGSSIVGKSITIPGHKKVEANKVYQIEIRIYLTNQYMYSDGTIGPRDKNISKNAIGVMTYLRRDQNTGRLSGNAVAIKDLKEGGSDQFQWSSTTAKQSYFPATSYSDIMMNKGLIGNMSIATSIQNSYSGLGSYTWRQPSLESFLQMLTYPGKIWEGDVKELGSYYHGNFDLYNISTPGFTAPTPESVPFKDINISYFKDAFAKVGGEAPSGTYWLGTECQDGTEYKILTMTFSSDGKVHLGLKQKTETAKIRPCIAF